MKIVRLNNKFDKTQLTLQDIKVGDRVYSNKLYDIYGIYIVLIDLVGVKDSINQFTYEGTIDLITDDYNKTRSEKYMNKPNITIIYNDPKEEFGYAEY